MTGENLMEYNVELIWDDEASVWVATSKDIPGLVLESDSYDTLIERVKIAAPELIELNKLPALTTIRYSSERLQKVGA